MFAQRVIIITDESGKLPDLPRLPPNQRIEAIFLVLDDTADRPRCRQPHPDIAGKVEILGDVLSSAPAEDWHQ
jgi:hypothetical protein